ncbi:MAG: APC family permease [Nitrososphaerota archaeon]|nr:APC family permease [Nitrososphaerota archaeon]MDG6967468.1 APC family permease [Nitrososphaerota archaeon]MDG6978368.1 APC family permease [Nitrososphaerota archaeon]
MALPRLRVGALVVKVAAMVVGLGVAAFATGYLYDEVSYISQEGASTLGETLVAVAALSLALTGIALVASLPESLRIRFRRPARIHRTVPVYGFGTVLAVGVGATLGSPLFVLIPQNIVQYEFVSVGSLVLAALLSIMMAKVYASMYAESRRRGLEAVGGPSFTRAAVGVRSVRYFVSRVSMWVANTALAAYSKIVFLIFDFDYLPNILKGVGVVGETQVVILYAIAVSLIAWTVVDSLFEERLLRLTGVLQVVLTTALVMILIYHSALLGATGSWNLSGLLRYTGGSSWPVALVINTGYLYLLFFGFQEIQALERDARESSHVTLVSWIRRGYTLGKDHYLGVAMILTVLIAAGINILYGLAVFAAHPSESAVMQAQIPGLYLAKAYLGSFQELLVSIAFLIATVTTFVPAFLAATRHLRSLGEDGYMPRSLANLSWLFTLVSIFLLAVSNQSFLVDITDFMVLMSLGIISLSGTWLRRSRGASWGRQDILPVAVGVSCFVAGGTVYLISSSVVVFGTLAILFAYLAFDIIELGQVGVQLFLSVLSLACLALLEIFPHSPHPSGAVMSLLPFTRSVTYEIFLGMLVIAPLLLLLSAAVDASLLRAARRP